MAAVNESQRQQDSRSGEQGSQTCDVKIRPLDSTGVATKVDAVSSSKIEQEQTKSSPFTDENFDDWVKIGSAYFIEEKVTDPEKYTARVEFLINTLKTGNVDKMLSQVKVLLQSLR